MMAIWWMLNGQFNYYNRKGFQVKISWEAFDPISEWKEYEEDEVLRMLYPISCKILFYFILSIWNSLNYYFWGMFIQNDKKMMIEINEPFNKGITWLDV